MYGILASGYAEWPIIKQLAQLLGWVMNLIFEFLDGVFGIQNIGLCIIIFTIIVYTLMVPITIKQQKFSKMSTLMNPEIQKVQKKYEGKRDNVSMAKQQEELQMIYDKYGTSPTGGCLPMLIQFPLLFALYPVIQNIPKYVSSVREVYTPLVNEILASEGLQKIMAAIGSEKPVLLSPEKYDYSLAETLVNALYKFQDATWATLSEKAPQLADLINETVENLAGMNSFLGINISEAPLNIITSSFSAGAWGAIIVAAMIPILSAAFQYLSVKLSQSTTSNGNSKKKSEDPMAQSMQTMTIMMPLMSLFLCFTLPAGLGLYWSVSALVRCVQTVGINKYMAKIPLEDIIAKNQEKAAKKREKDGVKAEELRRMATVKANKKSKKVDDSEKEEMIQKATAHILTAPEGTLAYKAASVNRYNTNQTEVKKSDKEDSK